MSLFFASKAIYPLSLMPTWLRTVSVINALTYQVDILRALMLKGGHSVFGLEASISACNCLSSFS
jgi:ABC-2 type transport system permease protein